MPVNEEQPDLLRFPIGKFGGGEAFTPALIQEYVQNIASLPGLLRQAVLGLNNVQLDTPYRPGGWTVRQVVHHLADSHLNSYIRFRLALTEDNPLIKPYEEQRWAELPDAQTEPVEISLVLLEALHQRWVVLLKSLSESDWLRTFTHPVSGKTTLIKAAGLYAWHGKHHLAHITNLRQSYNY